MFIRVRQLTRVVESLNYRLQIYQIFIFMFYGCFRTVSEGFPEVPWGFLGDLRDVSLFVILFQSCSKAYQAVSGGFKRIPKELSGNSDGIKGVLRVFRNMFHGFLVVSDGIREFKEF